MTTLMTAVPFSGRMMTMPRFSGDVDYENAYQALKQHTQNGDEPVVIENTVTVSATDTGSASRTTKGTIIVHIEGVLFKYNMEDQRWSRDDDGDKKIGPAPITAVKEALRKIKNS